MKTSTGFSTGGATPEDVKLMKDTVGESVEVKAAGGVRNLEDFKAMIDARCNTYRCKCRRTNYARFRSRFRLLIKEFNKCGSD